MHVIKTLQFIGVVMLCLTLMEVNMELVSSCDPLDLRTILVHVRQTQNENKQLQDKHNMDIDNLRKELNNVESLSSSKIKTIESKIDDSETKNEKQLNSLQGQINESKAEWESQQYLIETLQEKITVLRNQLNESETKISELNFLINVLETEVKRQVKRFDDLQIRLNKTDELAKSLKTGLKELNITFIETNEQLETIQDKFKDETNGTDGQWSTWSSWSGCTSTSCRKTRNRACNNPAPSAYGHMCEGNSMDVDICDLTFCQSSSFTLSVRLADGTSRSGRLEVSVDGITWGTVCDDSFDSNDARVACRMLGYSGSGVIPSTNITDGTGPIFLDNLGCVGTESSLLQCSHGGWKNHNCVHSEDVGVSC